MSHRGQPDRLIDFIKTARDANRHTGLDGKGVFRDWDFVAEANTPG